MNPVLRISGGVIVSAAAGICAFIAADMLIVVLSGNIHTSLIWLAAGLGVAAMVASGAAWQRFADKRSTPGAVPQRKPGDFE